ncbi:UNVERIFIED_CONTAM: Mannosyl-oligosaccharide 1,2-alpha-mannosidase IB [Siphonaria sp. JEL0065]|nr:Mannosyl-oligosaccharide 1,2-alpha-mannosidase IB [Siphonaria sp. JEL0065]
MAFAFPSLRRIRGFLSIIIFAAAIAATLLRLARYATGSVPLRPKVTIQNTKIGAAKAGLNLNHLLGSDQRGSWDKEKAAVVREMAKHAWAGYSDYAWGHDDLKPVAKKGHDWYKSGSRMLNTPVDSLDTLFIMGLTDEYNAAKELILKTLDFSKVTDRISVFETTIRVVGGLLGAYELDGDPRLLQKCVELVDRMMPAFDTANGIPLNFLNLSSGVAYDYNGGFNGVGLAAAGTLQLEFQYLSDVTGDPKYQEAALYVYEQMQSMEQNIPGLFPDWLDTVSLKAPGWSFQIGGMADSYYEYLLKVWLSTGEDKYYKYFKTAAYSIANYMVKLSDDKTHVYIPVVDITKNGDSFISSYRGKFPHLACFSGGMFAMGGIAGKDRDHWEQNFKLGAQITETCWTMYKNTVTGIGPDVVHGETLKTDDATYKLRPEAIESLFYMWRLTHDAIYRERGWVIAQSIEKYCRDEVGYHGLQDVDNQKSAPWDKQESFFIAETLKYLYLLFTDDDTIPLEKYVFNTEAHILSVRGHGRRANPSKLVPLPTTYKVPVGQLGSVSLALQERRKIEADTGRGGGKSFGVEIDGG